MTANRILLTLAPATLMMVVFFALGGTAPWLSGFGTTDAARLMLGRIGIALPYAMSGLLGVIFLFATAGASGIRAVGWSVVAGAASVAAIAVMREATRVSAFTADVPAGKTLISYVDPATMIGALIALMCGIFALRVALRGNAAFASPAPRRVRGKRAIHGDAANSDEAGQGFRSITGHPFRFHSGRDSDLKPATLGDHLGRC